MKGSHNSLTFARPVHWYHRLFSFVWKCQDSTISYQILAGVRCFDIRFAPAKNYSSLRITRFEELKGLWRGAHGAVDLRIDPVEAIKEIASTCPGTPYVRLILEKGDDVAQNNFARTCSILRDAFPHIVFFGGYYKPTWEQLYTFFDDRRSALADRSLEQYVGSMQSNYGKVFPRLWRRLNPGLPRNAKHAALPAVLLDFVEL